MTSVASAPSKFDEFVGLCEKEGLLKRPAELAPEDTNDGINDTTTLKYVSEMKISKYTLNQS